MDIKQEEGNQIVQKRSILLRIVSLILILEGALGFLFFTIVLFYQALHPDFLSGWSYGYYDGSGLYSILVIYCVLHLGLILSGILFLKNLRRGIFILILSLAILVLTGFILNNNVNLVSASVGALILFFTLISRKFSRKRISVKA